MPSDDFTLEAAAPAVSPTAAAGAYCRVAPEVSLDQAFDYAVPAELAGRVAVGAKVRVPFGRREVTGYVLEMVAPDGLQTEAASVKPLREVYGERTFIPDALMKLAHWIADYYCAPLTVAVRALLPEAVRQTESGFKQRLWVEPRRGLDTHQVTAALGRAAGQKAAWAFLMENGGGWLTEVTRATGTTAAVWRGLARKNLITIEPARQERSPFEDDRAEGASRPLELMPEQATALAAIREELARPERPVLLHGVTGSGKTEVYLQAINAVLETGGSALVLVPEIALTPQTVERFRARFAGRDAGVAVLHSHLSAGERHDQWHAIRAGRARIVIGARSAVFAPLEKLGLIVVDEEHETGYKQEETPHYHARDVAVVRGRLEGAVVVLGSATPSLESLLNAQEGKYRLALLSKRVDDRRLPTIHVLDLKMKAHRPNEQPSPDAVPPILAPRLVDAVNERLAKREQVILFLNRRGYASSVQCPSCGHVEESPTCSVPLTYHRASRKLVCHFSGYTKEVPERCPKCGYAGFKRQGLGTQRVEESIARAFPRARILRMDSDSMRGKNAHRDALEQFAARQVDILVGTQMIAKGLHFPNVTCVGVVNPDHALNLPDYRASERVFQLLCQVAGRAGRGDVHGEVFVQSRQPFHPAIQFARHHDYDGFAEQELEFRQALAYPPYRRAVLVTWRGRDAEKTLFVAEQQTRQIRRALGLPERENGDSEGEGDFLLGEPAPAPIERLHDLYRFHLLIRTTKGKMLALSRALRPVFVEQKNALPDGVKATVDVDPVGML
ncbi:MAG: primosomal protein N' [Verrucomicrobiota bacterium]